MDRISLLSGHLLTIEGGDGSGKTDQVKLLAERLSNMRHKVHVWDFPQYGKNFGAEIVADMLAPLSEYGEFMAIHPKLAALPFIFDRLSVREEMVRFMREGGIALCNRFSDSNLAHGAAKCRSREKAMRFIDQLEQFEYGELRIPCPDATFFLATDADLAAELALKKGGREYLKGAVMTDAAENDLVHQIRAREMYEYLCSTRPRFSRVECMVAQGQIDTREAIHGRLWEALNERFLV